MTRAAVLGAGSWGTAFSAVLADAGTDVNLLCRYPHEAAELVRNRVNAQYLPDLHLSEKISPTADPEEALNNIDIVVLVIPSQVLRENLVLWKPLIPAGVPVVSLMKGIELGTGKRMSEVIIESGISSDRVVALSGPNLAKEIAAKQPAAAVVAGPNAQARARVAEACAAPYFRPYTNGDIIGTEIAGAAKNIIALAVGMAHGLGLGTNTTASLLTRGLAENARLGTALGADAQTFLGLAGVGDLVATCTSELSRNHTVGYRLGKGESLAHIQGSMDQVAEGVKSCGPLLGLAHENDVDMPICENVTAVVHENRSPKDVLGALMRRQRKAEGS